MTSFGYKLLEVELYKGRGHKALDFSDVDGKPYLDVVCADFSAWEKAHAADTEEEQAAEDAAAGDAGAEDVEVVDQLAAPTQAAAAEGETTDDAGPTSITAPPLVRIEGLIRYNSAVLLHIRYGQVGDHDKAVDPEGASADLDLTGLATTRIYRALLITPTDGKRALLAVEVIGRSHPAGGLPRRLRMMNKEAYGLRKVGNVADTDAFRRLVKNGKAAQVELFKYIPQSVGAGSRAKQITLSIPLGAQDGLSGKVIERVRRWLPNQTVESDSEPEMTAPQEARALAAIVWDEAKELTFDDARVSVRSGARSRRLRPLDTAEGFIYDSGDEQLSDDAFVQDVASSTQALFAALQMNMEDDWALAPETQDEQD